MKFIFCILLLLLLPGAFATDGTSVEQFKSISSAKQRWDLIQKAPAEQREELLTIDRHLRLLKFWGGEEGLKKKKESGVAYARGFKRMEGAFHTQSQFWDQYVVGVFLANQASGMAEEKQEDIQKKLKSLEAAVIARLSVVHTLAFNMVASPEALELEGRIEQFERELIIKFNLNGMYEKKALPTKGQREEVDKQFDRFFEEMKKMPKLTPEQTQKEYDAYPEGNIPMNAVGGPGDE